MRTRGFVLGFVFLAVAITVAPTLAKRAVPKEVTPIERDGIIFGAPHLFMGSVEARFKRTNGLYWRKQVYVVKYRMGLEKDVQDCFITKLEFGGQDILVTNEAGHRYRLNPDTLEVIPLRGSLIIDRNKEK
jgi:hypothetical protein